MSNIRAAAVSGLFYPADHNELSQMIREFMNEQSVPEADTAAPKAIIVPHAGYIYSGPIAAAAYKAISNAADIIKRVVLLGPSHRVPILGLAVSTDANFATPLGTIPVDQEAVRQALKLKQVRPVNEAHTMEHSLEVQLPFLQTVLQEFSIVPFVVGDASASDIAEVLQLLWGGDETLIVISSDLSHYHDYDTARKMDKATSDAIVNLQPNKIRYDDACGRLPIQGLLTVAGKLGLHCRCLNLANSGDTAGDKRQVVGYGAYSLT